MSMPYNGVWSVHRRDIMSTLGGGGGGISWVSRGDIMINVGKVIAKTIQFVWKPQCTEHPPVYCTNIMQDDKNKLDGVDLNPNGLDYCVLTQGVYSDMYMTGGLGPGIFWDTQKNKYQEKSDPKK